MERSDPRVVLAALIAERGADCASLSRLIGRNPAYVQQFIRRGTPQRLAEADRAVLARFFGVAEALLGGPATAPSTAMRPVPRLDVAASAGPGAVAREGRTTTGFGFSDDWLRRLRPAGGADALSMIEVAGTSMLPTLAPGDEILVDTGDTRLRDGIYVLRLGDVLLVKRLRRDGDGFAILSDNPEADPVLFAPGDPPAVIGRVLWAGRRL